MVPELPFVCVDCGNGAWGLYNSYGTDILKLTQCRNCDQAVDKYIEYEDAIVYLDMLLLKKPAYRHFLYNTKEKSPWKLVMFLLLFEAYREWKVATEALKTHELVYEDPTWEYYFQVLYLCIDVLVFVGFLAAAAFFTVRSQLVVKGCMLASLGHIITLISALWKVDDRFLTLSVMYSLICQAQSYSVVTRWPLPVTTVIVGIGFLLVLAIPGRSLVYDELLRRKYVLSEVGSVVKCDDPLVLREDSNNNILIMEKVVPKLKFAIPLTHRKLRVPEGPLGRLKMLRYVVGDVIKKERIEVNYEVGHEARQYTERVSKILISDAVRYGPCHRPTMELADFWLMDKACIHKLFKVLLPRYQSDTNASPAFTRLVRAASAYPQRYSDRCVLELRGNPFPSLFHREGEKARGRKDLIHNVLLAEIRKERSDPSVQASDETHP
ncbi:unnamed protein product [Notodromas monacha]|uniref:Protein ARV n=1 Tax=Notodromas monacha TaxID=399045 RepID=A0A7R9BHB5_9CRUS|nr:unnamed protein product [Notodromas monacha]CAG0914073.1 unnamed protein product [Notodromas monacha]